MPISATKMPIVPVLEQMSNFPCVDVQVSLEGPVDVQVSLEGPVDVQVSLDGSVDVQVAGIS